jgi:hypothetical protein
MEPMAETRKRESKIRPKFETEEEAERFVKNVQETGEPETGNDTLGTNPEPKRPAFDRS